MEKVLCFSRFLLEDVYGWFEGISFDADYVNLVMDDNNYIFVEREQAEKDKHYKQIIPYIIFTNKNGEIFNYQRGDGGGEKRLNSLRSIGIGGHINYQDFMKRDDLSIIYKFGLYREVCEEFCLWNENPKRLWSENHWLKHKCLSSAPSAFLNEEETEVGKFHFGSVHVISVIEELIHTLEENVIIDAKFSPYDEILKEIDYYERWSQLCLYNWGNLNKDED